jgi:hypothetical protein
MYLPPMLEVEWWTPAMGSTKCILAIRSDDSHGKIIIAVEVSRNNETVVESREALCLKDRGDVDICRRAVARKVSRSSKE